MEKNTKSILKIASMTTAFVVLSVLAIPFWYHVTNGIRTEKYDIGDHRFSLGIGESMIYESFKDFKMRVSFLGKEENENTDVYRLRIEGLVWCKKVGEIILSTDEGSASQNFQCGSPEGKPMIDYYFKLNEILSTDKKVHFTITYADQPPY